MLDQVILVNEFDQELGLAEKLIAHQRGDLHRAFSVFVYRYTNNLEILLQQRHINKYHCGGLWSNACCSHPRPNESIEAAASRRLFEELGINLNLKLIDKFIYHAILDNGLIEHEYDYIFVAEYDQLPANPNSQEIQNLIWLPVTELIKQLDEQPQKFTPWLAQALNLVLEKL